MQKLFVVTFVLLSPFLSSASPVERVVNLLKDLEARILQDEAAQLKAWNKYKCWCGAIAVKTADSIHDDRAKIAAMHHSILAHSSKISELQGEVRAFQEEQARQDQLMSETTALRKKNNAQWQARIAELQDATTSLHAAIRVLREGTNEKKEKDGAFLQSSQQSSSALISSRLSDMINKLPTTGSTRHKNSVDMSFLAELASQGAAAKYAPQSMKIQGMLQDMYSDFAKEIQEITIQEAKENHDYEKHSYLYAVFTAETTYEIQQRQAAIAEHTDKRNNDQAIHNTTSARRAASIKFFDDMKEKCEGMKNATSARAGARTEELNGIRKTIDYLHSDAARTLFDEAIKPGKTVGAPQDGPDAPPTSFIQLDASTATNKAIDLLRKQAVRGHNLKIAQIEISLRSAKSGHFEKVINAIDKMIEELQGDMRKDTKDNDEYTQKHVAFLSKTKDLTWDIKVNDAKIEKAEVEKEKYEGIKEDALKQIAVIDDTLQEITKQRGEDHQGYLTRTSKDQAAIELLQGAMAMFMKYQEDHNVDTGRTQAGVDDLRLLQKDVGPEFARSDRDDPDVQIDAKDSHRTGRKAIIQALEDITNELKDEISAEKVEESESLQMFLDEKLRLETEKKNEEKTVEEASKAIAQEVKNIETERGYKEDNEGEHEDATAAWKEIEPDFQFLKKHIAERRQQRQAEIDGLVQAKEYLAGMNTDSFLQKASARHAISLVK